MAFEPFEGTGAPQTPPASGGFLTNLVNAIANTNRILSLIQQAINNSFVNLAANNVFTGTDTFKLPPVVNAGAVGTGTFLPAGLLSKQSSASGIGNGADLTDDTLFTYSLPASSLDANGRTLVVEAFGSFAGNGNNKTVKIFFGTSVVLSTGVVTTNNLGWSMRLLLERTGSGTQIATGTGITGSANIAVPLPIAGSETDTGAITIKVTGASPTTGAASDVKGYGMLVGYLN